MRSPSATFDLRASMAEEIDAAMRELEAAPEPKAVHRCRVHLKRARALARIGRACAPGLASVFNETARGVMRSLAQERDLAALAGAARTLAPEYKRKTAAAFEAIAANLDHARAALAPLNLESVRAGLRDLSAMAMVWPEASARQINKGAQRVARRARSAFEQARGDETPSDRHEWRKREKDRLYSVLLLNKAWPDNRKRRRRKGERLGEILGRERDALLLIARLESEPKLAGDGLDAASRVLKALQARSEVLGRRADALGEKLHAEGA